jgi:hypothetical protein
MAVSCVSSAIIDNNPAAFCQLIATEQLQGLKSGCPTLIVLRRQPAGGGIHATGAIRQSVAN